MKTKEFKCGWYVYTKDSEETKCVVDYLISIGISNPFNYTGNDYNCYIGVDKQRRINYSVLTSNRIKLLDFEDFYNKFVKSKDISKIYPIY